MSDSVDKPRSKPLQLRNMEHCEPLLSQNELYSTPGAFIGIVNLGLLMLTVAVIQLSIYNIRRLGLLVDWSLLTCLLDEMMVAIFLWALIGLSTFIIFGCMKLYALSYINDLVLLSSYFAYQVFLYSFLIRSVKVAELTPVPAGIIASLTVIHSLKMHSYVMTNRWLRAWKHDSKTQPKKIWLLRPFQVPSPTSPAFAQLAQWMSRETPILSQQLSGRRHFSWTPSTGKKNSDSDHEEDKVKHGLLPVFPSMNALRASGPSHSPTKSTATTESTSSAAVDTVSLKEDPLRAQFYPKNIHLSNFIYFLWAPTLVYEPAYLKRQTPRRKKLMLKLFVLILLCAALQFMIIVQFVLPQLREDANVYFSAKTAIDANVHNLTRALKEKKEIKTTLSTTSGNVFTHYVILIMSSVTQVIHLSIPSMISWFLGFYACFHCWLTLLAEAMQFGDRRFYADWWNATQLDVFWRHWNIPVHEWMLRHVFFESMVRRASKQSAMVLTFFLSAVLHEFILYVAFQRIEFYFFMGMLVQIPLIMMSKYVTHPRLGNVLVWVSLFVGQPMLEVLYIRKYAFDNPHFMITGKSCSLDNVVFPMRKILEILHFVK